MNQTTCLTLPGGEHFCVDPAGAPFYYSYKPELIAGIRDTYLTLATPVIAYWVLSLIFQALDSSEWKWLDKYRIHESAEMMSKNRVTKTQVVWAVAFQQVLQTLLGLWWMDEDHQIVDHAARVYEYAELLQPLVKDQVLAAQLGHFTYWWAVPSIQLLTAAFVIDTWQYFLHRAMHINKFLYRHFHSWHHRLYVPYAFGALYNHPVEGFVLDSLGTVVAEAVTGMTTRQSMVLFGIASLKTVDDHCGYKLPFDPLQMITSNNADYHDIHHQTIGLKANFSQPFFIHWDYWLNTRMTRQDIEDRRKARAQKAE